MTEKAAPDPSPLAGEGGSGATRRGRVRGTAARQPSDTVRRSRELRKQMGEPELRLWRVLREAFPDARFRRQVPFADYHADFCSHHHRLVIEVDGDTHTDREKQDAARTRFLEQQGYRVLRFANTDAMQNADGVCAAIAADMRKGRP